jgi:hypothetical protein
MIVSDSPCLSHMVISELIAVATTLVDWKIKDQSSYLISYMYHLSLYDKSIGHEFIH